MSINNSVNRLVIIGNGFDLAHGYKTLYYHFITNAKSKAAVNFEKSTQNHLDKDSCWYNFEDTISEISSNAFQDRVLTGNANINIKEINKYFYELKIDLLRYLAKETASPCPLYPRIRYWLKNALVINFNYTKTVEQYGCKPFYIHGNITEENAVLGYDFRIDFCTYSYEETYYSKFLQREILSFSRFLKFFNFSAKSKRKYIERYKSIDMQFNSPRGEVNYEQTFCDYLIRVYRFYKVWHNNSTSINYKKIKQLVVMGHSLKADEYFLNSVFSECKNLEEIILFIYENEPRKSIIEKVTFLRKYCNTIKLVHY